MGRSHRGKRLRFSRDEAEAALIAAGKRLLTDRGLDDGLGLVTLNDAIIESGVPRASAYRVFASDEADPQTIFRSELLRAYVESDPIEARRTLAQLVADEAMQLYEEHDASSLAAALREMIRLGWGRVLDVVMSDRHWRVIGPSFATVALSETAPDEIAAAHQTSLEREIEYYVPLYAEMAAACGIRLRDGFDWPTFAAIAHSAATADTFYRRFRPELQRIERPTGPDGAPQVWTHAALLVEGLALSMFESDPGAQVSADLSTWLS